MSVGAVQRDPRQPNSPQPLLAVFFTTIVATALSDERQRAVARRAKTGFRSKANCRGRQSDSPSEIPPMGWKDILWRIYAGISEDRILANAAAVVFYALLALFPAIAALVSN